MTDIQRHLKPIVKLLQQAVYSDTFSQEKLRQQLRDLLPQSYGITSGKLHNTNGESSYPLSIIIYDRPLAKDQYTETAESFLIDHVLLVIEAAQTHGQNSFQDILARTASFKALKPALVPEIKPDTKPLGQQRERIPKHRLPISLIFFNCFTDLSLADTGFFDQLHSHIAKYSVEQQPDFIHIAGKEVLFRNPLLNADPRNDYEMGLTRTPKLTVPRGCYVCKQQYWRRHFHYEKLCSPCGDLNYQKRYETADLSGQIALVTGARVKIGYAAALRLLRAGAEVIVTSRFPHDTARRYAQESDFSSWKNRLHVYGLDLRYSPGIGAFVEHLYQTYSHLDILINNAAQTVKRPPAYHAHLLPLEQQAFATLPAEYQQLLLPPSKNGNRAALMTLPDELSQMELLAQESDSVHFPAGQYDSDQQQIDNRPYNSWIMALEEVSMPELVEVHLINAVAPALLAGRLKDLMLRSPSPSRHIINVSSVEGQFAQDKRALHVHTNMSKAALNMLTRSIAEEYARDNIYVNSVDPGWVSDQFPRTNDSDRNEFLAELPLDLVDAAARITDPIFTSEDQIPVGKFLKDYRVANW